MDLSTDLISQFAKIVNNKPQTKSETTVYGTVVKYNGEDYVKLDGSDLLTPVSSTTNSADGDRVTVLIKDHTATVTGNMSAPSATNKELEDVSNQITEFEILISDKVSTKQLEAETARIDTLVSENVVIKETLTANQGTIRDLSADNVTIKKNLEAANASIENLDATKLSAEIADLKYAEITDLEATNADIHNLETDYLATKKLVAEQGEFQELVIENFEAINGSIESLETNKLSAEEADLKYANVEVLEGVKADFELLESNYAKFETAVVKDLEAVNADIENLETTKLTAEQADIKYANIDFSNIDEAAITKVFSESGIIKDLIVSEGKITGELVGVTIKGDLIEAGTLKADKLVVKGSDGLYYKLNFESGNFTDGEVVPDDGLHGSVIIANSITAEKIRVDDLVAFGATIGGFKISNNAIHSVVKTSVDNTTQGIYMDNDGQLAVGDADNFIKYYKDADGEYRLELSVGSLMVSHKNVEETLDGIQNTVNVLDETTNNRFDETTTLINEVNENSQEYTRSIVQDYAKITDLEETRESLSAEISTSATGIKTEVANTYMTITKEEEIYATIKSLIEQSEAGITMKFEKEIGVVENDILLNQLNYKRYIRFGENGIELGDENAPTTFRTNITNTEIYFSQGGEKIAYISNSTLYINNANVLKQFTIGREETGYYDTLVRVDKHWTLKYRTGGVS